MTRDPTERVLDIARRILTESSTLLYPEQARELRAAIDQYDAYQNRLDHRAEMDRATADELMIHRDLGTHRYRLERFATGERLLHCMGCEWKSPVFRSVGEVKDLWTQHCLDTGQVGV